MRRMPSSPIVASSTRLALCSLTSVLTALTLLALRGDLWRSPAGPPATEAVPAPGPLYAPADSSWVIERVDSAKVLTPVANHSLALDSQGVLHVAYGGDFLYYATWDGTTWHAQTVDQDYHVGGHAALALDAADQPHIIYFDDNLWRLKYAVYQGGVWQIEPIDDEGVGNAALALDAAGRPHIAYAAQNELHYAYHDGTAWRFETVDAWGGDISLALDGLGQPHISYSSYLSGWEYQVKYAYYDGTTWYTETIETLSAPCRYTSLALDAAGRPHVTYAGARYARYDGADWVIETVDGNAAGYTSLALDAADRPHISYYSWRGPKYAWYDGTAWQYLMLGDPQYYATGTALALDPAGPAHVAYLDDDDLRHVRIDGSSLITTTVDTAGAAGLFPSIALDSAGRPQISYYNDTDADLRFAWHDGTDWLSTTVDGAGDVGQSTSLAVDSAGRPHVSYFGGGIRHAWFDGAAWQTETITLMDAASPSQFANGSDTSLALDGGDRPHVAWSWWSVYYAYNDGAGWQGETVAAAMHPSLAVDSLGYPHLSYRNSYGGALMYAEYGPTGWQEQLVDQAGSASPYSSLALDAAGRPHIAYYVYYPFSDNGRLMYAYAVDGSWQIERVDSYTYGGGAVSLRLDAAGHPHISYYKGTSQQLGYAHHNGTMWIVQTPDAAQEAGSYNALTIDALGQPHIAYHDAATGDLMYAHQPCVAPSGMQVWGPQVLAVGQAGRFTAEVLPLTVTIPLTYTWSNGAAGPVLTHSWPTTGTYTLAVTATNGCGYWAGTHTVLVLAAWPHGFYLPVVARPQPAPPPTPTPTLTPWPTPIHSPTPMSTSTPRQTATVAPPTTAALPATAPPAARPAAAVGK